MLPAGLEVNKSQINTIVVRYWQRIIAAHHHIIHGYLPEILVILLTVACCSVFLMLESVISAQLCWLICVVCGIYAVFRRKFILIFAWLIIALFAISQHRKLMENFSAAEEWVDQHGEVVGRGNYFAIESTGVVEKVIDASEVHTRRIVFRLIAQECASDIQSSCNLRLLLTIADLPWKNNTAFKGNAVLNIRARIRLLAPREQRSGYENYLYRRNIVGQGYLIGEPSLLLAGEKSYKEKLIAFLTKRFVRDEGMAILIAAVVGDHSLLGVEIKETFKNLGVMHLLVVSGFHIALIYLICRLTLRALFSLSLVMTSHLDANGMASVLALFLCCIYVLVTDTGLSSQRALIGLVIYCSASLVNRKASRLNVLLISFLLINLVWPSAIVDIGCQLTYAALIGLFLADIFVSHTLGNPQSNRWQKVLSAYIFSYFAWLLTAPILLYWFDSVPLAGPVVNLLVAAYFSIAIIGLGLVAMILSQFEVSWLDAAWHCAQEAAVILFQQLTKFDNYLLDKQWSRLSTENLGASAWSTILVITMPLIYVVCHSKLKHWLQTLSQLAIVREAQNPLTWSREASKEANDFKKQFHRSR